MNRYCLLLLGVNCYWGLTQVLVKNALCYMSASSYCLMRFGTAALLLGLLALARGVKLDRKTFARGAVLGGLIAIQMLLSACSLHFTSTSNSVLISQLTVVVVPVIAALRSHRRLGRTYFRSTLFIIVGLTVIAGLGASSLNIGDGIALVSTLFACGQVLFGERAAYDSELVGLAVAQMLIATAISALALPLDGGFSFEVRSESIAIVVLTGLVGSGVCHSLYLVAQKNLAASTVSLVSVCHPIFAMIGAATIPNELGVVEEPTPAKVAGAVLVVIGMVVYARGFASSGRWRCASEGTWSAARFCRRRRIRPRKPS